MSNRLDSTMTTTPVPKRHARKKGGLERFLSGPWPLVLPALVMLALMQGYPIVSQFYLAMTDLRIGTLGRWNFVGLENFAHLFSDPRFLGTFRYTFIFVGSVVVLQFVVGLLLALLMDMPLRGRLVFRLGIVTSWVLSGVIVGYMWRLLLIESQAGILNGLLRPLGIGPIQWLSSGPNAQLTIIGVLVWKGAAWSMVFMLAGLQTIAKEVLESATIDGASAWQKLIYIKLPLIKNVILISLIFSTIAIFAAYDTIFVLTGGGPGGATEVIAVNMFLTAFGARGQLGMGAAMGVTLFSIIFVLVIAYLAFAERKPR